MSDNKKTPQEEKTSKLRKLTRNRWFYPAVYLCAAAVVMITVLWVQNDMAGHQAQKGDKGKVATKHNEHKAVPAGIMKEEFKWPVADKDGVKIAQSFYDFNGDSAEQEAALVNYDNTYTTNKGINFVANDNKSFDVTASMSGKVVQVKKDPILGYVVELKHKDGVTTMYQSLASVAVENNQSVKQGDVIGTAGTDKYNKDAGVHLHFEIRKDGVPVDPVAYFQKGIEDVVKSTKSTGDVRASEEGGKKGDNHDKKSQGTSNSDSKSQMDNSTNGNMKDQGKNNSDQDRQSENNSDDKTDQEHSNMDDSGANS